MKTNRKQKCEISIGFDVTFLKNGLGMVYQFF